MLRLDQVNSGIPTFAFVGGQGGKKNATFLKCSFFPDDATRLIAVRVLEVNDENEARQPLTGRAVSKWSCSCWPSRWLTVEVIVDGNKTQLSVDVKDIVKKWNLDEKVVRQKCGDNAFQQLVMQVARQSALDTEFSDDSDRSRDQFGIASKESSVADPEENSGGLPAVRIRQVAPRAGRLKSSNSHEQNGGGEPLALSSEEDPPTDDGYRTLVIHTAPDNEELAGNAMLSRLEKQGTLGALIKKGGKGTLAKKKEASEPVEESKGAEVVQESVFDKFPFEQLKIYLETVAGESESIKLVRLFQKEWKGVEALIGANKASWRASCERNGAANMIIRPNPHSSLHIEYFYLDDSVWIHFNCNQTALALNLSTGLLCRRMATTQEHAEKLTQIQRLAHRCPFIDCHVVSAFKGGSGSVRGIKVKGLKSAMPATAPEQKDMFRVMTPFFGTNMADALGSGLIRKETRDEFVFQWLQALDALHAADIAHFAIGPEALLIQTDPRSGKVKAVIGGFSRVFFISQPPDKITVTADFHKAMPPECREQNGSMSVPKNAKAVDIYQLATCLQGIYADLFINSDPVRPSKMAFTKSTRNECIQYIIEQMLNADPDLLRISADKAVAHWKSLPEK